MSGGAGPVTPEHLRADCGRCAALCCVAPAFARSADFAFDKPAGTPCRNLLVDLRCGVHDTLLDRGMSGCVAFDCFGAGQQVVQVTFGGQDWRDEPALAARTFEAFAVMRQLHELLWYLLEARGALGPGDLLGDVEAVWEKVDPLTRAGAEELLSVDAAALRAETGDLLARVSTEVRAGVRRDGADHRGADLVAADLRGRDLRGASLRGALLLGADLRGADLRRADLLGADLRAADLGAARLDGALFLTQPQVQAARGDGATVLSPALVRPAHWRGPSPA